MLAAETSGATVHAKSKRTDSESRLAEVDVSEEEDSIVCRIIDQDALPSRFPTRGHQGVFWECLGRTVATFGFLGQVLGRAIFALSTAAPCDLAEIDSACEEWSRTLKGTPTDLPGNLVGDCEQAVGRHRMRPRMILIIWSASFGKPRGFETCRAMDRGRRRMQTVLRYRCLPTGS